MEAFEHQIVEHEGGGGVALSGFFVHRRGDGSLG